MFTTKIYIKTFNGCQKLNVIAKGDWIDLYANEDFNFTGPIVNDNKEVEIPTIKISLGVAMKLPSGFEALVESRSSTYNTYGLVPWNCLGIIDNSYNGPNDQWQFGALCLKPGHVRKGDRVCQFRIQLSQKATIWQKIKWLFSNKVKFVYVPELYGEDRSGFGKGTGKR